MTVAEQLADIVRRLDAIEKRIEARAWKNELRRNENTERVATRATAVKAQKPRIITDAMAEADREMVRQAKALIAYQGRREWLSTREIRSAVNCVSDARWIRISGALCADKAIMYHHGKGWCRNV